MKLFHSAYVSSSTRTILFHIVSSSSSSSLSLVVALFHFTSEPDVLLSFETTLLMQTLTKSRQESKWITCTGDWTQLCYVLPFLNVQAIVRCHTLIWKHIPFEYIDDNVAWISFACRCHWIRLQQMLWPYILLWFIEVSNSSIDKRSKLFFFK